MMRKNRNLMDVLRTAALIALVVLMLPILAGCGGGGGTAEPEQEKPPYTEAGQCMNTAYEITIYDEDMDAEAAKGVLKDTAAKIRRIDGILNHNVEGSEVYQLNHAGGERVTVSQEVLDMMSLGILIGNPTGGAIDMTMGGVNALWGFDGDNPSLPADADIKAALEHVFYGDMATQGNEMWLVDPAAQLDFTLMAKSYIAFVAAEIMREAGVKQGRIEIGGSIIMLGEEAEGTPWIIDIENVKNGEAQKVGTIEANDIAIATTCTYEKTFEQDGVTYHHILDPVTGYPVETDIESATIIAVENYSNYCSILSATCILLGNAEAQSFISDMASANPDMGLKAVFLLMDGTIYQSEPGLLVE